MGARRDAYGSKVLAPVESHFAKAVASGALIGKPEFLMLSFLHMTRALEMMDEAEDAECVVSLFLDGAGPARLRRQGGFLLRSAGNL